VELLRCVMEPLRGGLRLPAGLVGSAFESKQGSALEGFDARISGKMQGKARAKARAGACMTGRAGKCRAL